MIFDNRYLMSFFSSVPEEGIYLLYGSILELIMMSAFLSYLLGCRYPNMYPLNYYCNHSSLLTVSSATGIITYLS